MCAFPATDCGKGQLFSTVLKFLGCGEWVQNAHPRTGAPAHEAALRGCIRVPTAPEWHGGASQYEPLSL